MLVRTAEEAAALFAPCFAEPGEGERLAVAHVDGERRLIELVLIPAEAPREIALPLRRIVEDALRLGSEGLVIAHDHPSGDPQPSRDDIEATRELAGLTARLGIRLHDHLIFGGGETCSLRALGLL